MLERDRLFCVRFGQQARCFNDPILNDRLHLRQRQHALAERVKRPRRLAFPYPALIVQHPPPLSMIEGAERITGPQQARATFHAVIPKKPVYQTLIHDHLGAQSTITWGRSGTITWGHNPISKNPYSFPVVVTRFVEKQNRTALRAEVFVLRGLRPVLPESISPRPHLSKVGPVFFLQERAKKIFRSRAKRRVLTGSGRSDNPAFAGTGRGTGFSSPNKELTV